MAMIEERYVSFEIAKLLKEKGFNEPCRSYFIDDTGDYRRCAVEIKNEDCSSEQLLRPTFYMAMEWLRKRLIDIIVFHERLPEDCYWARIEKYPYVEHQQEPIHQTYEVAVEAAILYSLENLV